MTVKRDWATDLARWLRLYRKQHDLTQTELAQKLGWTQPVVARMESATRQPTLTTLQHLVKRLGGDISLTVFPGSIILDAAFPAPLPPSPPPLRKPTPPATSLLPSSQAVLD